jgi:ribosomal protein S18 acetylase RimI-like enzyme
MEHKALNLKNKWHKYSYLVASLAVIGSVLTCWLIYLYWPASISDGIHDYNAKRDRQAILDIFEKDWYWMVEGDHNSFSPAKMLDAKSPKEARYNPALRGQEKVKVLLVNGSVAGFISYYKRKAYLGHVHLINVLSAYRGHGYANKLMRVAIEDLFSDPTVSMIKLAVRKNNQTAIKLYKRLGFVETNGIDGYSDAITDFALTREAYIK